MLTLRLGSKWLVICGLVGLSACLASAPPDWAPVPPQALVEAGKAKTVLIVDLPLERLPLYCGAFDWGVALACVSGYQNGIWVIFTSTREQWVLDHEYAHIGGWEHD